MALPLMHLIVLGFHLTSLTLGKPNTDHLRYISGPDWISTLTVLFPLDKGSHSEIDLDCRTVTFSNTKALGISQPFRGKAVFHGPNPTLIRRLKTCISQLLARNLKSSRSIITNWGSLNAMDKENQNFLNFQVSKFSESELRFFQEQVMNHLFPTHQESHPKFFDKIWKIQTDSKSNSPLTLETWLVNLATNIILTDEFMTY